MSSSLMKCGSFLSCRGPRSPSAGFDGKVVKFWGQGKQIFNPVDDKFTVPTGPSTKDFVVPDSAGQNVKVEPTSDE